MLRKNFLLFTVITPIIGLLFSGLTYLTINHEELVTSAWHYTNSLMVSNIATSDEPEISDISSPVLDEEALLERLEARLRPQFSTELTQATAYNILNSTVRILTGPRAGSGVVVFEATKDDKFYSYILTNAHVVNNNNEVKVERFNYLNHQNISSITSYTGKVIDSSQELDLAIVQVESGASIGPVARFDTLGIESKLLQHQKIFISGCALGKPPFITHGNVANIEATQVVVTAFSIFGSSGGGVFNIRGELVGLVRGISMVSLRDNVNIPEPNLTMVISGPLVRSWLLLEGYNFLLGDTNKHDEFIESLINKPLTEAEKKE
jgi:S1-C subfamily serine protease